MTYVMSDIHGCFAKYRAMLEKIGFSDDDTLYILGDLIDRGDENVAVVRDVMKRENVRVLRGNHDAMAATFFREHPEPMDEDELWLAVDRRKWLHNGRDKTYAEYHRLTADEKEAFVSFLENLPLWTQIEVGGKSYHLSHSVPERDVMLSGVPLTGHDYVWSRPNFAEVYYPDRTIIIGHTPTEYLDGGVRGRIWYGPSVIDIDCGAVFGDALGCLRLDDMTEYYVSDSD